MSYTAETFLNKIKPLVIADMESSGILASLTAAQAFIESNKGNSGLTTKANNLFGIKGTYNGQSVTMLTTEYYNGVKTRVNAAFRKYPSWAESIADHSAMFNRMSRYKNLRGLKDYRLACKYVKDDGYATSPTYTQTLLNCITKYKLYEWDGTEPETYTEPTELIKLKSRGDGVKWVQTKLNEKGYKLAVDGIAGMITIGAVMDFQKKHGLVPDGIVGPDTKKKLNE